MLAVPQDYRYESKNVIIHYINNHVIVSIYAESI